MGNNAGRLVGVGVSSLLLGVALGRLHSSPKKESGSSSKTFNQKSDKKYVLVTGGAGFIGTHTCIELFEKGFTPIVVDNFYNSCEESIRRVGQIIGQEIKFYKCDLVTDTNLLMDICKEYKFVSCIHFAGLKAVGESVKIPNLYYRTNLVSTLNLLDCLNETGCKSIIFSSSATVYGLPDEVPIKEDSRVGNGITNPYGFTKYFIEQILIDYANANKDFRVVILRYFNPIGAHPSGLIGEDPQGIPNNLMPYIAQVAIGRRPHLSVFGNDYPTVDGTGVRDYIHVSDLARGHIAALEKDILEMNTPGVGIYNLGTGRGTSVLELFHAFEKACGKKMKYVMSERRVGDIASCYADSSLAEKALDWKATLSIEQACIDTWNWQSKNPNGFK